MAITGKNIFEIELEFWKDKPEDKLKKEIKHEKVMQRKIALQQVYDKLKKNGIYKNMRKENKYDL